MKPYRNRTVPYKVLAMFYNADYNGDSVRIIEKGTIRVFTGVAARQLRVSNGRFLEAIEWLKVFGFVKKVDYPIRGQIIIKMDCPKVFLAGKNA